MPTRRIFEVTLLIVVLWDLGKGTAKLWTRKTWAATEPGSLAHSTAEIASVFL